MKKMTKNPLTMTATVAALLSLTACGGGGGGATSATDTPAPSAPVDVCTNLDGAQTAVPLGYAATGTNCTLTDACTNYAGLQTELELIQKHFVRDAAKGACALAKNHEFLATSGLDVTRMAGLTGKGVTIAIDDGGFVLNHEEFAGRVDARSGTNIGGQFMEGRSETQDEIMAGTYEGVGSGVGHGTWMASNALGERTGAAPGARLLALAGTQLDVKDPLARGVNIISASNAAFYGYELDASNQAGSVQAVLKVSQAVVVAAAGNDAEDWSSHFDLAYGKSGDTLSLDDAAFAPHAVIAGLYETTRPSDGKVLLPSGVPGYRKAIQDRFLVTGTTTATFANVRLNASGLLMTDAYGTDLSGTSDATAATSGAIAVVQEANPRLTAVQAAQALLDTAVQTPAMGYGATCSVTTALGTFKGDCGKMKFGRGLMNVPKAVELARTM